MSEGQEQERVYADKQLVITRTGSPGVLVLTGAIDHFNASAVAASIGAELRSVPGGAALVDRDAGRGDLHLDVSGLEFADVSGIRALVLVAEGAGAGRRLVLHGLPAGIRKAVSVVGWADLPYLVLDPE